ncbi:MAG: phosphotransferase family protein [Streptosporangiaceae bacterium]
MTALDQLARRGLVPDGARLDVQPLAGGVSGEVFAVTGPGVDLVVKRALGRLRVSEEWLADPGRIATEARALRLAASLTPGSVPEVVDLADGYLVLRRAPRSWTNWRDDLLGGAVDPTVARRLGQMLGAWQRRTADDPALRDGFADRTAFTQLRVDPFHRTAAARHGDVAAVVDATVEQMLATRACLVHGDFSPKNVLTGWGRMWVLDWEVAHVGDPTFDPAFLLTHLLLKSVHRPEAAGAYGACAREFLDAFAGTAYDPAQLVRQVGCLLLARVDGKSPAGYLTARGQERVRALGRRVLLDGAGGVLDLWAMLG